jgi:hypothetical protein
MKHYLVATLALSTSFAGVAHANEKGLLSPAFLAGKVPHSGDSQVRALAAGKTPSPVTVDHGSVPNIDSIVNFTGSFTRPGFDSDGNAQSVWKYAMIGHSPRSQEPALIGAPVIPVILDLRNEDGSPRFVNGVRLIYDASQFVKPVLNSPVFRPQQFGTSIFPTQYTDAIHRAEFWRGAGDGDFDKGDHVSELWHTILFPLVRKARTMQLNANDYQFALNADGSCCAFVLVDEVAFSNALYPPTADDTTSVIGAAEHAGDMTTKQMTTLLFPNTFLYEGDPSNCCVVGFHSYDWEPGDAKNGNREKRYVFDYASWVTPGLFGDSFSDVTALSHELAEAFNDPFVGTDGYNMTPWWMAPFGLCQNNLETGDVVEGLPANVSFPMVVDGFTYHPQNEALFQWFTGVSPSTAWHKAYSFPDTTVLTTPSDSLPAGCAPPTVTSARK